MTLTKRTLHHNNDEHTYEAGQPKNDFLAVVAHELRNTLAPISTTLHLIELPDVEEQVKQEAYDLIKRQVNYMNRLIDDLLDISRISNDNITLHKEIVPLPLVIQHAIDTSMPLIKEANHSLTVILPPEDIKLEIDLMRIVQVVANLLNNAAKYTNPKGNIFLIVEKEVEKITIKVKDNGIGISDPMLPSIFTMFSQVDSNSTQGKGGLGIGLALAKNLVELHHGTIEALSEGIGKGSEFIIRLPHME